MYIYMAQRLIPNMTNGGDAIEVHCRGSIDLQFVSQDEHVSLTCCISRGGFPFVLTVRR